MESTQQPDQETYRAIVLGRGGNELLLASAGDGFLLPSVEIPRWERIAKNLATAMRDEWGHEVICLFTQDAARPGSPNESNYQVMECYASPVVAQPRAKWIHVSSLSAQAFADPQDFVAVQRSLAECTQRSDAVAEGPFTRLGWFRELRAWIAEIIRPTGLYLTGKFSQLNASPSFSLVRFETNGPAVWFKAVGEPNLREFPITLALGRFLPQYIAPILATLPAWHGWLASEVEGTNLVETQDAQQWAAAASALAKLQIESIDRSGVFVNSGARDLRASVLLKLTRPFLNTMGQLMEKQTKVPPPVLSRSELTLLGEQIEEALCVSTHLSIPDALGHLDLNPENVFVSGGHCAFLDWAEAYVGNPFFSLQYLVQHFRSMARGDTTAESILTSAYAADWKSLVSPETLAGAFAFAPVLAVFAYAVATDAWGDQTRLQDPGCAGYLRSLTRRMHREANRLRDRSAPCPN